MNYFQQSPPAYTSTDNVSILPSYNVTDPSPLVRPPPTAHLNVYAPDVEAATTSGPTSRTIVLTPHKAQPRRKMQKYCAAFIFLGLAVAGVIVLGVFVKGHSSRTGEGALVGMDPMMAASGTYY
jgi:hypothetical protein